MEESNLVKLIRTLKGNEKRYVAIYLSKHIENNNLLKLFKIISEHPFLSEEQIAEKINDDSILYRLRQSKFDLYNLLLDALHRFDLKKSPYGQVLTMMHQSEILLHKGLLEAAMELLSKAGKLADVYELTELKLEIIRLQSTLHFSGPGLLKEKKRLINKITERSDLKSMNDKMLLFLNKTGERLTIAQRKHVAKMMSVFEGKSVKQDSFYNKYALSVFFMRCYRYLGNFNQYYINGMKLMKLFKQHPDMLRIYSWRWLYCYRLQELLLASFRVSKNKTAELVFKEISNLDISDTYKNDLHINVLDYYIQAGEFKKGEAYSKNIQYEYIKNFLSENNKMILNFNAAIINFGAGDYSKALSRLNEILNSPKRLLERYSSFGIVRLIRLITYYELKKLDALEYEIRSTLKHIENTRSFRMDQLVVNHLLKMISTNDKIELRKIMEEARTKLLQLSKIKAEASTLELFDFIAWFESKIENRSFESVVKERARRVIVQ